MEDSTKDSRSCSGDPGSYGHYLFSHIRAKRIRRAKRMMRAVVMGGSLGGLTTNSSSNDRLASAIAMLV
jgi:fluoride ion exporter CrcB/FEX